MLSTKRHRAARGWDLYASGLSFICMLHCLGLPFLVALLPAASQMVDDHLLHVVLVLLALPVTLWVVWREVINDGSKHSRIFATAALTGLSLMVIAVTVLEQYEVPLTLTGGTMLGAAHLWRWFDHRAPVEENA